MVVLYYIISYHIRSTVLTGGRPRWRGRCPSGGRQDMSPPAKAPVPPPPVQTPMMVKCRWPRKSKKCTVKYSTAQ